MMQRAIVNVATGRYIKGQQRLVASRYIEAIPYYFDGIPPSWPSHESKPYAFKAYAMKQAADRGADLLLWCDACILPVRNLEPLWERIEREGYWISRNGWTNYEWTAVSAYEGLFRNEIGADRQASLRNVKELNKSIPHVVATAFGLNVKHPKGKAFLDEYHRLASETQAFCGPWINSNQIDQDGKSIDAALGSLPRMAPCGPPDVRGHRHDQTAASVIAWRLGFELSNPPSIFAYGTAAGPHDERTILVADGAY